MNAKRFVRCVGQFGLPCVEQQYQRSLKSFFLFWSVLFVGLFACTLYQFQHFGGSWLLVGLDSFSLLTFALSAHKRYLVYCYIDLYRQKQQNTVSLRGF